MKDRYDCIIIGGGPAGLAAAISARENGISDILVVERNPRLGGILPQCIHEGFGLIWYKEVLTGPEYAQRLIDTVHELEIEYVLGTSVIDVDADRNVTLSNREGVYVVHAEAIVLSMGCRERTSMAVEITGSRPSGIYTAGTAQNLINLGNNMVGRKVIVVGSGDIGLIMARRMTLEGAKVEAVIEIMEYPGGLQRNIVQCLEDYDIPLLLSHSVTDILGAHRVEGVRVVQVDGYLPVEGTERIIECDTVLVSVGLIPENELSKKAGVNLDQITGGAVVDSNLETSVDGIFACGNVLHVHDLVDYATEEGERAGWHAADFVHGKRRKGDSVEIEPGNGIRYVIPHHCTIDKEQRLFMRVQRPGENVKLSVTQGTKTLHELRLKRVHPSEMLRIGFDPTNRSLDKRDGPIRIELMGAERE